MSAGHGKSGSKERRDMKGLIMTTALLLMAATSASAQNAEHPPWGQAYIFVGGATHQMGATLGFGGELRIASGLSAGLDVAGAGLNESTNGNRTNFVGLGSADLSYHFFPKKITGHVAPFLAGGYTNFFGQDVFVHYPGIRSAGNYTNGYNVGGGIDVFGANHLGVRFDVRYYAHGGRILWASFPNDAQLDFVAFRIGLTFR
jgi:hypothetical protein